MYSTQFISTHVQIYTEAIIYKTYIKHLTIILYMYSAWIESWDYSHSEWLCSLPSLWHTSIISLVVQDRWSCPLTPI